MLKSLRDVAREIRIEVIEKDEKRALKRARDNKLAVVKVYRKDMPDFLERGWEIISHTQSTYNTVESYQMSIDTEKLRARYA